MVSTGIPDLDHLLIDGYPIRSSILVEGSSGTEKDALGYRFVDSGLLSDDLCIYVTRSSPESVIQDAKAFGVYFQQGGDGAKCIVWKCSQSGEANPSLDALTSISFDIKQILKQHGSKRLRIVFDLLSQLLLLHPTEAVYRFLSQLLTEVRKYDATFLATLQEGMHGPQELSAVEMLFDGVLTVKRTESSNLQIQVKKMRGVKLSTESIMIPLFSESGGGKMEWIGFRKKEDNVTQPATASSEFDRTHIAVLPFTNLSPDPQEAYFADGMTEEIICTISGISALSVISRTSTMSYKETKKNLRKIGEELKVGSILEGSLRKIGKKIRVTAQLIDVPNDRHLWAHNYDRSLEDVFAIQSEIASSIADELKIKLVDSEKQQRQNTRDIDAYSMFMKASQLLYGGSKECAEQAIALLEQAVLRDPSFVRAHAALAYGWWQIGNNGYEDFDFAVTKAEDAALKALQLGPDIAESHAAMANVYSLTDRFEDSILEAEKAIQINPNFAQAHETLATERVTLGQLHKALDASIRAHELDPLSMRAAASLSLCYQLVGREEEALDVLIKLRDIDPKRAEVYLWLSLYYISRRDIESAQEALETGINLDPEHKFLRVCQGALYALEGKKGEAERELRTLSSNENEGVRLSAQLLIQTALGNFAEAFEALRRMAEKHCWPYHVTLHPFYKDLRKDPRFGDFCREVGIMTSRDAE